MRTIRTREVFTAWLDDQMWLQDALVDSIDPVPTPGTVPDRVQLAFRVQVDGGIRAGQRRRMRELVLSATGVARFELPTGGFTIGNCCQGADVGEDPSSMISLVIGVPMELRLDCIGIDVTEREWEETVPVWLSNREFVAVVPRANLPSPAEWIKALSDVGLHGAWRCYGGPAEDLRSVPRDYVGWFLQQANRIESTTGGVFFFAARQNENAFHIQMQRYTDQTDPLWSACAKFLGSVPGTEVHCGNATLSGSNWLAHLATGYLGSG